MYSRHAYLLKLDQTCETCDDDDLDFRNVKHESLFLISLIMLSLVNETLTILIKIDDVYCIIEKTTSSPVNILL